MRRSLSSPRFALAAGTLACAALLLPLGACGGDTAEPSAEEPAAGAAAETSPAPAAGEVEYEPAYPEEVSAEGLAESDAAQQEEAHAHGDETHVHEGAGDEEHDHGDGGHSH